MFISITSNDPNTVTVTALKTHDTPTTAPFVFGTIHIKKTLKVDSTIAATIDHRKCAIFKSEYTVYSQIECDIKLMVQLYLVGILIMLKPPH